MLGQVDLLAELRVLSHPASVDSVTTSANQEDHVSMGMAASRKAHRAVGCLERVIATELLCAAQGIDLRRPLKSGSGVEAAWSALRTRVPKLEGDRALGPDLDTATALIADGVLSDIAEEAAR